MGNNFFKHKMEAVSIQIDDIDFHGTFIADEIDGLTFNGKFIPEEIFTHILSYIEPRQLLRYTEVCKTWCNIIKSDQFWRHLYILKHGDSPDHFPWYVYYNYFTTDNFQNLLKNPNGAEGFRYWTVVNGQDNIKIECPPIGSEPLPKEKEFDGDSHCFATSYMNCSMSQNIELRHKRLLLRILKEFKLPIYASDWTAGRFDCSSVYNLAVRLETTEQEEQAVKTQTMQEHVNLEDPQRVHWRKVDVQFKEYPDDLDRIVFMRNGKDKQFWAGNYGSKMSGGTVKFLLINPIPNYI